MKNEIQIWRYPARDAEKNDRSHWQQKSLPVLEAARLIRDGKAEPVIHFEDHAPKLPKTGKSLSEAFQLYVAQHPSVVENGGLERQFKTVRPRDYKAPPSWGAVFNLESLTRPLGYYQHERENPTGATDPQRRRRYREFPPASPEEISEILQANIAKFVEYRAIHRFLEHLQSGRLSVLGVAESNLAALKRRKIPSAWWARDIVVHVEAGEIWELTARNRRDGVRRWSSIRVDPMNILDAKLDSGEIDRTGGPGRPSSMHLVWERFHERVRNQEIEPTLAGEARNLAKWFDTEYEGQPHPTGKTIENNIRIEYNRAKEKKKIS